MTLKQYNLMRHAIGFERNKIKYNKYTLYRNYFCAGINTQDCMEWYEICNYGYGNKSEIQSSDRMIYFEVTQKGLDLIANQEKCKIIFD